MNTSSKKLPNPVEAVFFDLDGTFLDTAPSFIYVLNELLKRHDKQPLDVNLIRETVSDGARALVKLGFNISEGEPGFEALRQELLELYEKHLTYGTQAFPGIDHLIEALEKRSIQWGIITNKPSLYANPLLEALGYLQRSAATVCPDHVTNTKPDPEPMLLACSHAKVKKENCIYVGDHLRDIEAGRAANMYTIACRYGYVHPEDNVSDWNADYIIDSVEEILSLIDSQ